MNKFKTLCLAAAASASLTACGAKFKQEFADAAPNYDTLSMDMTQGDKTPDQQAIVPGDACHPHLFWRTRNVVRRLNHHVLKVLARMDALIDKNPTAVTATTHIWEKAFGDVSIRTTATKKSDTEFDFVTELKAKSDPATAYVQVATSTVTKTDGTPHTGSGTMTIDLSKLKSVVKGETAEGTLSVNFNVTANTKTLEVTVADFVPADSFDGPGGTVEISPRNAHYVFTRSPGVGGSLKYQDQLILACPENPGLARADVNTVARWTVTGGKRIGRADSQATGGQLAAGLKVEGVTCADFSNSDDAAAESYWMMKAEDATGATVRAGATFTSAQGVDPTTACDPSFGAVPNMDNKTNDFDFTSVNFLDATPAAYPGEPTGS